MKAPPVRAEAEKTLIVRMHDTAVLMGQMANDVRKMIEDFLVLHNKK
jgi:hypothetical protein